MGESVRRASLCRLAVDSAQRVAGGDYDMQHLCQALQLLVGADMVAHGASWHWEDCQRPVLHTVGMRPMTVQEFDAATAALPAHWMFGAHPCSPRRHPPG